MGRKLRVSVLLVVEMENVSVTDCVPEQSAGPACLTEADSGGKGPRREKETDVVGVAQHRRGEARKRQAHEVKSRLSFTILRGRCKRPPEASWLGAQQANHIT